MYLPIILSGLERVSTAHRLLELVLVTVSSIAGWQQRIDGNSVAHWLLHKILVQMVSFPFSGFESEARYQTLTIGQFGCQGRARLRNGGWLPSTK
ncbi:hypothetical protein IF1G_03983 [Cordyceps javanica]|uniref:Uncharacterized protein n=1 Tax=Cordyceps javanica TaxID=43265 RepID=A0A545V4V3_9HYPO|nr:hypothetical protein IF1G_03983 [Cordyceps javanica]